LQGATGALLSGFLFLLRTRGAKSNFFVRVAAKRASQPRMKFSASAGVLVDAPDGHKRLVITLVNRARMDLAAASRLTKKNAPAHCWQRRLARLRREYPPEVGQQSTIGRFAISEIIHWSKKRWHA